MMRFRCLVAQVIEYLMWFAQTLVLFSFRPMLPPFVSLCVSGFFLLNDSVTALALGRLSKP